MPKLERTRYYWVYCININKSKSNELITIRVQPKLYISPPLV